MKNKDAKPIKKDAKLSKSDWNFIMMIVTLGVFPVVLSFFSWVSKMWKKMRSK